VSQQLRVRVISGIVIGVITIGAGLLGGIWWGGFLLGLAIRAADEMISLIKASGFRPGRLAALLVAAVWRSSCATATEPPRLIGP
jgi:CDP-diglyceride synthetase